MKTNPKKYDEGIPDGSPSQDKTDRYSDDQRLRSHNFRIHARPDHGPALWSRENKVYTFAQALKIAQEERNAALARLADSGK